VAGASLLTGASVVVRPDSIHDVASRVEGPAVVGLLAVPCVDEHAGERVASVSVGAEGGVRDHCHSSGRGRGGGAGVAAEAEDCAVHLDVDEDFGVRGGDAVDRVDCKHLRFRLARKPKRGVRCLQSVHWAAVES